MEWICSFSSFPFIEKVLALFINYILFLLFFLCPFRPGTHFSFFFYFFLSFQSKMEVMFSSSKWAGPPSRRVVAICHFSHLFYQRDGYCKELMVFFHFFLSFQLKTEIMFLSSKWVGPPSRRVVPTCHFSQLFDQSDGYCKELMVFIDFKENSQEYKVQVFVESFFSP